MEKTIGLRGIALALVGVALLAPVAGAADPAQPPSSTTNPPKLNSSAKKSIDEELERQRRLRSQRQQSSGIRVFKDRSGVPLFTNRIDKYRNRPGYKEVRLDFERIRVEPSERRLRDLDRYNAASIEEIVKHHAERWGLDKNLVFAIIKAESNFRQDAVSSAGACGLMQLMPGTAGEMGVEDIFDPAENIAGGTQYLAKLLELFENDYDLALAGYNSGPQTVINCGRKIPNIRETQQYVKRVRQYWEDFAGQKVRPEYVKAAKNPRIVRPATPKGEGVIKTIYFNSGLTQPVEKIIDQHPDYYYVQFKGRMWSVPKKLVKEIK